jgi:acyl-CoA thioesterase-1
LWNERNIYYKSIWDGRKWSNPVEIDIPVLPEDFLQEQPVGSGYISWSENNLTRSIRILEPAPKKILTACNNNSSYSIFAWLTNNIDPVLYAAVEDNKYIAFGDSITYGMGGTEGYPSRLQRLLTERVAPSTVVNEGIPGERTPGGVVRFDDVLNNNAKYMLIMEGTNDITMNYSTESIIFNLGQMIDRSISFGTTPLIALLTPRKDGLNGRVADDVNPAISQLATDKGILLVDQYSEMNASKDTYMFDHVHPNDAGYGLMAEIWCRAIKDMLSPPKEEKKTGCGAIPPIAQKNGSGGLYHNLSFLVFVFIFLVYYRFKFSK